MEQKAKPRVVTFDEPTHKYYLNGKPVDLSVTGVLSLTGFADFSRIPADVLERKRRLGSRIHLATELIDTVGLDWDSVKFDDMGYLDAYQRFCNDLKPRWVRVEQHGVMDVNGLLCGWKLDRAGWINDKPYIVELKCAYSPEDYWKYQLAGYSIASEPLEGQVGQFNLLAVQLQPNGDYRLYDHSKGIAQSKAVFRSALQIATVHVAEGRDRRAA